jgi:hypothetical protein
MPSGSPVRILPSRVGGSHQAPEGYSILGTLMGFTKLDEAILQSSIMAEDSDTFKVWIALLASCEPDGISHISPIFLASVCHLSQDKIDRAIVSLESPDPYSRTIADEGRRIRKVDGGYFIVNYEKYRGWTYSQKPAAVRQRKHREKPSVTLCDKDVTSVTLCDVGRDMSASSSLISFLSNSWINISEHDLDRWKKAYPSCDVKLELKRMIEWLKARPRYAFKDGPVAFIVAWLARSQKSIDEKKALALEVPQADREQKIANDLRKR